MGKKIKEILPRGKVVILDNKRAIRHRPDLGSLCQRRPISKPILDISNIKAHQAWLRIYLAGLPAPCFRLHSLGLCSDVQGP